MKRSTSTDLSVICEGYEPRRFFWLPRIGPHLPDAAEMTAWVREHRLTDEECDVYDLMAERRSAAEIAEMLGMNPRQVAECVERVHAKLDAAMPSKAAV
jgi:DNA-binding CsgD family transcriptional regulator